MSRDYVWMDDTPVAVVDASGTAFVHADGLNTPRAVTNAAGALTWSWAYQSNPFGEGAPTSTNGFVLNLRFPGQYFDVESGTSYNVNRNLETYTGRYLQSDPQGVAQGPSTYAYVGSNPLSYIDPLGLDAVLFTNTRTVPVGSGGYAGHSAVAVGNDDTGWTFYQEGDWIQPDVSLQQP